MWDEKLIHSGNTCYIVDKQRASDKYPQAQALEIQVFFIARTLKFSKLRPLVVK
jgi:hypothetical protein